MANLPKSVALIYDRVNKWGGAERVLLALHEIFPHAPLFTSVYDSNQAKWAQVFPQVTTTFLNFLPGLKHHHELIPFLTPISFETLQFDNYDAVISLTSADAKGIITKPQTFHLCVCLTPTRYLWSHQQYYYQKIPWILKPVSWPWFKYLKYWDLIAAKRPDKYLAISKTVADRISKYYARDSRVIYPPVNTDFFSKTSNRIVPDLPPRYYLYVGRFVTYKDPQTVINVFNDLNFPLVVVGKGSVNWGQPLLTQILKSKAGPNIRFIQEVSDDELAYLYQNCQALIYFHEEDFGIIPVEAMAAGKPVIALNRGGTAETVIHKKTGILIDEHSPDALKSAVLNFSPASFSTSDIRSHAAQFSQERFIREFVKVFNNEWTKYQNTLMS